MSYQQNDEFQTRTHTLQEIRAAQIEPYPASYRPSHQAGPLQVEWEGKPVASWDEAMAGSAPSVRVAGRLRLCRPMGKNIFAQIQDGSGTIQLMWSRDVTQVAGYEATEEMSHLKFLEKRLDLGDWIGVEGQLFRTQKGELTVLGRTVTLLAKSLLPLPDKHAGLQDKEIRYRKRWLDLIAHDEVRRCFQMRAQLMRHLRRFFEERGFTEVETPALQTQYGGAAARPFLTHLNALDMPLYLRISPELSLKKLLVGGMERIFEIARVFRNEGIDRTHNPEFTILEAYGAYMDYHDMMGLAEQLYEYMALNLLGTTQITTPTGDVIDVKTPWKRLSMQQALLEYAGHDIDALSDADMRHILRSHHELAPKELDSQPRGCLIALLFEESVEPHLLQPHHIYDFPVETTPLCKPHRDPLKRAAGWVERFESYICSQELCNAYSELNDPELQRTLLERQAALRASGDDEANPLDEEFLEAIYQGMPPAGGIGFGIDRMAMIFTSQPSIRDVLLFPLMRNN